MNLSPKQEPIGWSAAVGLIIAALASYGFGVTPELRDVLVVLVPVIGAALWARMKVFTPKSVQQAINDAYAAGAAGQPKPAVTSGGAAVVTPVAPVAVTAPPAAAEKPAA